ncbi:type I secretion system permease/ATPase [Phyllobacterium endophyticum]|uniref:Type I secretion system permease/ATPase n=1 Tax=Phyllobacterium endophyticum TaxID=1149773 RepID=A0A2P7AVT0_9HYPH|nr:type I secretion system permease/ATPase [Phyllobacterium endophyticum]MBB3234868.1 ATP-binding cassette subfamily C protein/ATP-binding cassette subfamily C protein EexD [Phyllobacterium endophyticum]PSH58293.1 type I secretion system permease/ATPase [Phyllobacterium endophyticum]TYR38976.1 type I secretion system permease/ATPase [Phyllobacterium endophyticum]
MALTWMKTRATTEIERAFNLCKPSLFLVFILSFFVNLLALTVPLYLLQIYDHVLSSRSLDTLTMLTMIVIVALAVNATLDALRRSMLSRIGSWLDDRLQAPVLIAAVQSALRGDSAAAAQAWRDIGGLRGFFAGTACTALFDLPWTPIFILAMLLVHPLLGIIGLAASVVLIGLALLNEMMTRKLFARSSATWVESQHRFGSLLRNVEAISAMGMLPGIARLLHDEQTQAKEAQLAATARATVIQAIARFVRLLAQVIVMACAAWLVILHDISPAAIFATSILLGRSLGPVEGAINTWKAVTSARLSFDRLRRILASAPKSRKTMQLPRPNGQLSVEQLTFMPQGAEAPALRRLTFVINPGEVLGVVGSSGAGKSTLGRLIAGTIAPTAGHVRLDNADVGIWLASGGHRYFGYLPQDIELIGGTVRENISRLQEAQPDEVIAAASLVGMHDMIMRLPRGYETDIGDGGVRLSGGLRQRLGLARAFFGHPRLIVLDEPNASLDAEGEDALRQAIQEMRNRGSTVIVIAQRLGILNMADKVLVLDNGSINAFGNRRDIAEKIRNGRTSIPVRRQRLTTAARSIKRLSSKASSEQPDVAAKNASVKEKTEGNAS